MHFLSLLAIAASVQAHFVLDYPPSRGFDEDVEASGPCGGFNTISSNRTAFSINGGQYQIDSHHATAIVSVVISADGTTFGSSAVQQYSLTGLGDLCATLPPLTGFTAGSNATLQIIYKSSTEATALYQCADVQLTEATVDVSGSCSNGTGLVVSNLKQGSVALSSSSSTNASTSASASHSGASHAASSTAAVSGAVSKAEHARATLAIGAGLLTLVAFGVVSI